MISVPVMIINGRGRPDWTSGRDRSAAVDINFSSAVERPLVGYALER